MRIDKYLKNARIIKRRSVANEACSNGRVFINGKVAKAGTTVKIDDVIEIRFGSQTRKYKVLAINEHVRKENASGMFEEIG